MIILLNREKFDDKIIKNTRSPVIKVKERNTDKHFIMINNHVEPNYKKCINLLIENILLKHNKDDSYVICAGDFNTENKINIDGLVNIDLPNNSITAFKNRHCENNFLKLKNKSITRIDKIQISNNLFNTDIIVSTLYEDSTVKNDNGENLKNEQPFCNSKLSTFNRDNTYMCIFNTDKYGKRNTLDK